MTTSEARIQANRMNAQRSSGPKTSEGKERSRANALKHGLTGDGVVLPQADAAEVERRASVYARELDASGELEVALARRVALNAVRMERGADQQTAALTERIRQVEADFVPPEGANEPEIAELRSEAARRAMFDTSKEATLARRYEAAAERNFFRAIKELRQIQKRRENREPAVGVDDETLRQTVASFLESERKLTILEKKYEELDAMTSAMPPKRFSTLDLPPARVGNEVPFAIGRPR